jgi:hypothetical protein
VLSISFLFFFLLTPKIPCDFGPNYAVFDIVGKSISQKSMNENLRK